MTWWMWGVLTAITWGVHYNLIARVLTVLSPISIFWLPIIPLIITLPFYYKTLLSDAKELYLSTYDVQLSAGVLVFTTIIGTFALYRTIAGSNPYLAALIEISYPIFVIIFAAIIFSNNYLSWSSVIGGLLIVSGTVLVIYHN